MDGCIMGLLAMANTGREHMLFALAVTYVVLKVLRDGRLNIRCGGKAALQTNRLPLPPPPTFSPTACRHSLPAISRSMA